MIRYQAKTVVDAVLEGCSDEDVPRFSGELFRQYRAPETVEPDVAFALLDAVLSVPLARVSSTDCQALARFAAWWLDRGGLPQRAAAARLFRHLLDALAPEDPTRQIIADAVIAADSQGSMPLCFLLASLGRQLGLDVSAHWAALHEPETVSGVFLDNLKTATPWVLKAVGVEYLLDQVERDDHSNVLHIATHFSNLIKVSENIVVRRMAGEALLSLAPVLTPDRRNEIAVELCKALETGQAELSQYIPVYLGRFALWLTPRELDEVLARCSTSSPPPAAASFPPRSPPWALCWSIPRIRRPLSGTPATLSARRRVWRACCSRGSSVGSPCGRRRCIFWVRSSLLAGLSMADKTALFTRMAKNCCFFWGSSRNRSDVLLHPAALSPLRFLSPTH